MLRLFGAEPRSETGLQFGYFQIGEPGLLADDAYVLYEHLPVSKTLAQA